MLGAWQKGVQSFADPDLDIIKPFKSHNTTFSVSLSKLAFIGHIPSQMHPSSTTLSWVTLIFMLFVLSTLFRMGFFGTADRWGTGKKVPSLKPVYTYPAMMKLSTVTPYLKKIQKIYKSRDTSFSSANIRIFHRKSATFVISRKTDVDCILTHNFKIF